uniref:Uncharacterized protein n=1 Tax=Arundo donax TaxID=35708 RepID=A0A0A9GW53_ARUDO
MKYLLKPTAELKCCLEPWITVHFQYLLISLQPCHSMQLICYLEAHLQRCCLLVAQANQSSSSFEF